MSEVAALHPPLASTAAAGGLRVTNVTSGYGRVTVIHGVSFEAQPGEVLGIAGPNGAGKTTLLNAIAGLEWCGGEVRLDKVRLEGQPAHRRVRHGLALVPEGRQIIGSLSVRGNLDITVMARRRLRLDEEHLQRRTQILGLFPRLNERLDLPGRVLSGGEQQMLAIARALMTGPRVLLLDEPSQGLAPALVRSVVESLARLKRSVTIVIVEQNPFVLEALADRILTLRLGQFTD